MKVRWSVQQDPKSWDVGKDPVGPHFKVGMVLHTYGMRCVITEVDTDGYSLTVSYSRFVMAWWWLRRFLGLV